MSTRKSDLTDQPPGQKNLADILRRIEGEILRGRWAPGTRIPAEWELCERFGASRPMVREALQSLKARGLVVSRRGSGRFIPADPGWHGMSDLIFNCATLRRDAPAFFELFDLRRMVETFCVRRVAGERKASGMQRLTASLARMEDAAADLRRFGRADIDYHLTLVEVAGHRLFREIMRGLMKDLGRRFAAETYTDHALVARNLADHRRIQKAIEAGDVAAAERFLTKHLAQSRSHLEKLVRGSNAPAHRPIKSRSRRTDRS